MKSRCRRPATISLKARVSWPTSSRDRRERRDPGAARGAVDARIARDTVLEGPAERLEQLGSERIRLPRPSGAVARDEEPRPALHRVVVRERPDRRREEHLGLHRGERLPEPRVRAGILCQGPLDLGVERRIHEEGARPRDVEELRADRVLDLALLALVDDGAHETGGKRSEEHTSELQSRLHLVCRLLLEKKKKKNKNSTCRA